MMRNYLRGLNLGEIAMLNPNPSVATGIRDFISRVAICVLIATATPSARAQGAAPVSVAEEFVSFDVPGSSCAESFGFCTTPVAINPEGDVTGYYADSNVAGHAFLRRADGAFVMFDAPGSTCTSYFSFCTQPAGINSAGTIAGSYCDAVTCHGFVRHRDGSFVEFDPPGSLLTGATGITPEGTVTGTYYDINFAAHGFLRMSDGTFTFFDPQGSAATVPVAINAFGAITGNYYDSNFVSHGFVRYHDGTLITFDLPGSSGTFPTSINPEGTIAGFYSDSIGVHGFRRDPDGALTSFDGTGSTQTYPTGISSTGVITGDYVIDSSFHGFLQNPHSSLVTFDPPGSVDTYALGVNPSGTITGWYIDAKYLGHGFIRIPPSHRGSESQK